MKTRPCERTRTLLVQSRRKIILFILIDFIRDFARDKLLSTSRYYQLAKVNQLNIR